MYPRDLTGVYVNPFWKRGVKRLCRICCDKFIFTTIYPNSNGGFKSLQQCQSGLPCVISIYVYIYRRQLIVLSYENANFLNVLINKFREIIRIL